LSHAHATARRVGLLALAAALILSLLASTGAEAKKKGPKKPEVVKVMTRNLYLGADLAPAIGAKSLNEFTSATGKILRDVTANDFPTRAKGLAQEIIKKKPDLVGLQEVALWRTGPPSLDPLLGSNGPTATTVRYDYLQLLLDQLNKGKKRYRVAVANDEFDFEAPGDENGVPGDGPNKLIANAEINGRLTMRDVILVKADKSVKFSKAKTGHFSNLLVVELQGVKIPVTRGWASIDAQIDGGRKIHFVDTHFESFDPASEVPSIRSKQAGEMLAGPLKSKLATILVGDLNSDDDTVEPGDQQAYRTLLAGGMRERSTDKPLGCCLNASLIGESGGGNIADFDHQVDHVMTADPKTVKLKASSVTGRTPVNGFWDSDHAGLFSSLELRR
jgi:endonuclease/exonuclease/phosphatase family metal-dependent hydrolase